MITLPHPALRSNRNQLPSSKAHTLYEIACVDREFDALGNLLRFRKVIQDGAFLEDASGEEYQVQPDGSIRRVSSRRLPRGFTARAQRMSPQQKREHASTISRLETKLARRMTPVERMNARMAPLYP